MSTDTKIDDIKIFNIILEARSILEESRENITDEEVLSTFNKKLEHIDKEFFETTSENFKELADLYQLSKSIE